MSNGARPLKRPVWLVAAPDAPQRLSAWTEPWTNPPSLDAGAIVVVQVPDAGELTVSWMDDTVGYTAVLLPGDYPETEAQDVVFRREMTDAGFYLVCQTAAGDVWIAEHDIPEMRDVDVA
jgi:hypothetical protein